MATEEEKSPAPAKEVKVSGPELRLLDRRAFVGFPPVQVFTGLAISDFALQIPDVTFPFNITGGASRYQRRKLHFGYLELTVDAELISRHVAQIAKRLADPLELKLHFRPGYLEGQARLAGQERTPVTFKVAFDGDGERLSVYLYDVRLYGYSPTPAAQVVALLSRAVKDMTLLPEVELRGASGFTSRILPPLVELAAVARGYKMPSLDQARLSAAEVSTSGVRLRFSSGGLPPPAPPDEEFLLALEGARAFADAERLVAEGKLAEARDAYLRHGEAYEAHPFAVERLLGLLVADGQAHELALDVAQSLQKRRERSATALWAEAVVRERRGESARAAERYLALSDLARRGSEDASAFCAAEAAARAARDQSPQMAVRALHELLGLRPDHLPSLKALARAADLAQDRAGAIRAYRRISALARDPADAADAHVNLARLAAQTEDDVAGARLHCEAALRLQPDHPDALYRLGELCFRAGEHLRAIKALDRLREVALGRHEVDRIGRANLLAGKVWEEGLGQLENALLRYREAVSLLPGEAGPLFFSARVAEKVGNFPQAISGYQQAIELVGPGPESEEARKIAHQAHHRMAELCRTRLSDPAKAREHLEAALSLDEKDLVALEELVPYFRASGRVPELAAALEKAAAIADEPVRRAAFLAEAGDLFRNRLGKPEKAERLLGLAVENDPRNRVALEGMLALAESRRDGGQLCRCLKGLYELSQDAKERGRTLRRLAVAARDLAFDLDLAAFALSELLKLEPDDLPALGDLCGLERRRGDMHGLARALEQRARVAEGTGDKRLAAAALRELAQVLEARLGRVGEALVALERAARLLPEQPVLVDLAELSLRCDRPEHARRALEDALAQLPANAPPEKVADIRSRLGRAALAMGDKDAARDQYAQAFPFRRLDDDLALSLESLLSEAGQNRELAEVWAARAQAFLTTERAGLAAPLFFKSAKTLLSLGEKSSAVLRLSAALDAAPDGAEAGEILEIMAHLELERGAHLEAAKLFARRAKLVGDPRAQARLFFRAVELAQRTPREEEFLAQAIMADPRFAPARIRRSELQKETDPRRALEDIEAALATPLGDEDGPSEAERVLLAKGAAQAALRSTRAESARKYLALYVAQRPKDLEAARQLIDLHRRAGAKEALADLLGDVWSQLSGPERGATCREYAELCLELGRTSAAVDALRNLLEADAQDAWAAKTLLGLLPKEGGDQERTRLLSLIIPTEEGDGRSQLLWQRAQIFRRQGKLDEARADLSAAADLATQSGPLLRELADVARDAKDRVGELETWKRAVEKDPALGRGFFERICDLSRALLLEKNARAAKDGFACLAALDPKGNERLEVMLGLAESALAVGDRLAAAEAFLEASKSGPAQRRAEAFLARAALLEEQGDLSGASDSFEGALGLVPRLAQAREGQKRVLRALEDWEGLAEVLAAEASEVPKTQSAPLWEELGLLFLERLEKTGPAEAAFRKAAQADKGMAKVREHLVELLCRRGVWPEAAQFAEEAADVLSPTQAAAVLRGAARRCQGAGELELALRLARRAHQAEPAQGEDLHFLADLLYRRGAVREAMPLMVQVAREVSFADAPDTAEAVLLKLADLAESAGDEKTATENYRRVLSERPLCRVAAERLSSLWAVSRPRDSVEVLWEYARGLGPGERTVELLLSLADRAEKELADVDLAGTVLERAAEIAQDPLVVHRRRAELFRVHGRSAELLGALQVVAELALARRDVAQAIEAWTERVHHAERAGRVDDALRTLERLRTLAEDQGDEERAAAFERQRAELFRDAKLDLDQAARSLEKAFELCRDLRTTEMGAALAERRGDAEAHADWIERSVELIDDPEGKARAHLALARIFAGRLKSPQAAEANVREALRLCPSLAEAEALWIEFLEREGRASELGSYYEEAASREPNPEARVKLLQRAASVFRDRAGRPDQAAAVLLAARSSRPDDLELTAQVADLLHQAGREPDAAEFDALLLEKDPFRKGSFERHSAFLRNAQDHQALASLWVRRAERESGNTAAASYLEAAEEFRRAGAEERALVCEDRAFEKAPGHTAAFQRVRARVGRDVRRLAQVLALRAQAVPGEAVELLTERAGALRDAGEALLAAEAFDELLALAGEDLAALSARAELAAAAGGPLASLPYDRRILAVGGEGLDLASRMKCELRVGHASLVNGALSDAADAFETVVRLDPEGDKGREALSLLAEVFSRTHNAQGLYRTQLRLASRAKPEEAEAFLRRAQAALEDPKEAIDALLALVRLRPADAAVVERTAQGLKALGRMGDLVELYERSAEAVGGALASEWLMAASSVADAELKDSEKAFELLRRALAMNPDNPKALGALIGEQRRRNDRPGLRQSLARLIVGMKDPDEASLARLELAQVAHALGDLAVAQSELSAVVARGSRGAGYREALERLTPLLEGEPTARPLGENLSARAQLASGEQKADLFVASARAYLKAGDTGAARAAAEHALEARRDEEAFRVLADACEAEGALAPSARALTEAAALAAFEKKGPTWLLAARRFEAAGQMDEARALYERVGTEAPGTLSAEELGAHFARLGAVELALEHSFRPALEAGRFEEALGLADAAKDADRARAAMSAWAERGTGAPVERLAADLKARGDFRGLWELGEVSEGRVANDRVAAVYEEIAFGPSEFAQGALERLFSLLPTRQAVDTALRRLDTSTPATILQWVLDRAEKLSGDERRLALEALADALPGRRVELWSRVLEDHEAAGRFDEAAKVLHRMIGLEKDATLRAGLRVRLGQMFLENLDDSLKAADCFELALADDPRAIEAAKRLVSLYGAAKLHDRFVSVAEQLNALVGPGALVAHREALVEAYLALGRGLDAYKVLSAMDETPEVLRRRIDLARSLGLVGEALQLEERSTERPEELEGIVQGYLQAELLPFAARLGQRLLARGKLAVATRRLLAEKLAGSPEGAEFAVRLWPDLLRENVTDADGWTLFAEALRRNAEERTADMVDGFGAALTGTLGPAPRVPFTPLQRAPASKELPVLEPEWVEISKESMPRLAQALRLALDELGAPQVATYLNPLGGVEAFLAEPDALVLGAGALSVFGPAELGFLCALALALGAEGVALARPGHVSALAEAASEAFKANPASLAAARVVAHLEGTVRGRDPSTWQVAAVLKNSEAFRAVAFAALALV